MAQRAECYQLQDLRLSFWSLRLRGGFLFESVLPKANNTGYLPLIPWGPTLLLTQCPSAWKSLDGALYLMTLNSLLNWTCSVQVLCYFCTVKQGASGVVPQPSCPGVLAGPHGEPSLVPIWISESNYFTLMSTDMENSMSLCTHYPIRPPIPLPAVMLASPGDPDSWR